MALVAGKYVAEKDENFSTHFKGYGLNDEQVEGMLKASKELEIKASGNEYTLTSGLGSRTFPLDKEIDEKLPDGVNVLKSTASLSGNKLSIKSIGPDGKKGERLYEASESGLVLTFTSEHASSGKIYYKRA